MLRLWMFAIACAVCAQIPSVEELWKQGVRAHQEGRLEQAAASYTALLAANPGFIPALSNLGAVYSRLGRYADAAQQFRKALEAEPAHFGIRLNLAIAYYNQSRLIDAVNELELLRKEKPEDGQVTMLLADSYLRLGENKKVIELVDESAEDRAGAYVLGSALLRDGQIERGQKIIDRVFRDGSAESLMLIGAAEIAAQENKKALATLERAIAKNPKLPELFSLYGRAKLTDGDPAGAKDAFLKELEHNPSDYESNLQLGALFRIEKDYEKAAHYLGRAQEVRPQSLALKYQLASLELATGDLVKATKMLEEVTKAAPAFVEGHITLATAYYRQKRKADGDRERAIVDRLNAENQARELKK